MPRPSRTDLRIALIGAGRVGTAVSELLRRGGHSIVGVSSRQAESAERGAAFLKSAVFDHRREMPPVDVLLLGVPDGAISSVASEVAPFMHEGIVVIHFAGALGLAPLAEARTAGAGVAALHPVQSLPDVDSAIERLPGSAWGVTAPDDLQSWARDLVTDELRGFAVMVSESERPLWHAAAVTTSNGIVALFATAESMLASLAIERPQRVLGPLAAGSVANAQRTGGDEALTGPVVRGEDATIAGHLEALAATAPHLVEDYARVARVIVGAALRARRIGEEDAERMLGLLEKGDS
jgi:predicted short-subunit dehydrogenase-like oxidoreductase (DUF2520 family)